MVDGAPSSLDEARLRLQETFGFSTFRPGQELAIEAVLAGRDALVVMPTGSGKSLCYQVPALVLPGVTIVVSPLIALMKDQVDSLALRGVPVTFINSSIGADQQWERIAALERGDFRLVYVAPERFRSRVFRSALGRVHVSLLAVDEAHCISQWGHDFRPDYRRLKEVRSTLPGVPAIALTATATPEVREDIANELELKSPERVITGFDRPNLHLHVRRAGGSGGKLEALRSFLDGVVRRAGTESLPAGIIYAGTRRHAEEVSAEINSDSGQERCRAYHAGLEADARRGVQEDFMEGRLPWVAATNAFGMGVDKSDIRFVVHYDVPGSIEAYYQEIGRGGRDGLPAHCLLLYSDADRRLQEFFIEGSNPDRATIQAVHDFLFDLGQNPIFRTLADLETLFKASTLTTTKNPLVFRSSVAILERAGALERLDHFENLAEITALRNPWPENPHPERATVRHALHVALGRVFARLGDEPAQLSLERWALELGVPEESLRRGLSHLEDEGWIRYVPPFRGRAIRLPDHPVDLATAGIDFEALRRRRERDEARLEELLRLTRSRTCRRDAVLRYFGEEVPPGGCGRCDACGPAERTGARPRSLAPEELLTVRKALSGVARARGRCGRRRVSQMLRGSKAQAVASLGFRELSTFGLLKDWGRDELDALLEELEGAGCLTQVGDKYPRLVLTNRGVEVMRGERSVDLVYPRKERPAPLARPSEAPREDAYLDYDEELFEKLRSLRRTIAEELGVPAYRIFNDRSLRAMARDAPTTESQFLGIPGVGSVTMERFGRRFIGLIRSCSAGGATSPGPGAGDDDQDEEEGTE